MLLSWIHETIGAIAIPPPSMEGELSDGSGLSHAKCAGTRLARPPCYRGMGRDGPARTFVETEELNVRTPESDGGRLRECRGMIGAGGPDGESVGVARADSLRIHRWTAN